MMGYNYADYKDFVLSDKGQRMVFKIRDKAYELIDKTGCVIAQKIFLSGDVWESMACVDRLVEMGYLYEVEKPYTTWQHKIFTRDRL